MNILPLKFSFRQISVVNVLTVALCSLILFQSDPILAQNDQPYRRLFILGNAVQSSEQAYLNDVFMSMAENETTKSTVLFLGDFSTDGKVDDEFLKRADELDKKKGKQVDFIPGDKEWSSFSSNGYRAVRDIEKDVEDYLKKGFFPSNACPGPHEKKLDDETLLIGINSSWFLHPHEKPVGTASECDLLFETEFWDILDGIIEDNDDKNIVIAGHHPIHSSGYFGGGGIRPAEFIPVIGPLMSSYRRYDGSFNFLSNDSYRHYRHEMEKVLDKYEGLVYISGHEHSMEIQNIDGNLHINSGAIPNGSAISKGPLSLFVNDKPGFIILSYFEDGRVEAYAANLEGREIINTFDDTILGSACSASAEGIGINNFLVDCLEEDGEQEITRTGANPQAKEAKAIPGQEYGAGFFRTWLMGQQFRDEWTTEVSLPLLDLDQEFGGLVPFARGGGKQTNSLKLKRANGEQFAFRSVNKNTGRDPYDPFRNTIATIYTQELISNQLPFGDVVTSRLLDNTDILHMHPRPFIMPDDPKLGEFRSDFAGVMATMEERPKGKKKKRPGFGDADIVVSSNVMYRMLFEDNSNTVDRQAFARAILFDFWVGDWDRHGDNWKWAGFEVGKHYNFKPIPKDRDHVFSLWEGFIPKLAERLLPFAAHFSSELTDIKSLTFQGRHFVNFVGSKLDKSDWDEAAVYLQSIFNEELIADAYLGMPAELRPLSEDRITTILLDRLPQLNKAAETVYSMFNRIGLVVGSNEREQFEITRQQDGNVAVKVISGGGKRVILEKTFSPKITDEIHIYGLAKDDKFHIQGTSSNSIEIRVIGGSGEDEIVDHSQIANRGKLTKVYDKSGRDTIEYSKHTQLKNEFEEPIFNVYNYEYNSFLPLFTPAVASDNRFSVIGTFRFVNHGFNKPDFKHKITGSVEIVPDLRSTTFEGKHSYRYFFKNHDLITRFRLARADQGFDDFYGLGNLTERSDDDSERGFSKIINDNYSFSTGFENAIFNKSSIETAVGIEHFHLEAREDDTIFDLDEFSDLEGIGKRTNLFISNEVEIDFRNSANFPSQGSRFLLESILRQGIGKKDNLYGSLDASYTEYYTFQVLKPTTLAFKLNGGMTFGDAPFFHLSSLGSNHNLRSVPSNLLLGKANISLQSQVRFSLGSVQNRILPFNVGALAFYDQGRVFEDGDSFTLNDLRYGYGAGLYFSFLHSDYNVHFTIGENDYDETFFKLGLGLGLE